MTKKWNGGEHISPQELNELQRKADAYDELMSEKAEQSKTSSMPAKVKLEAKKDKK